MEGDEIFASIDSLWFYSSVFFQPSSKQKSDNSSGELQPKKQKDSTGNHEMNGGGGSQSQNPRCIKEATPAAAKRRAAARSRELDERMEIWRKQWRQTRVATPARCSPSPMPPPGDGLAMKAHLRSWAHAVACSVR